MTTEQVTFGDIEELPEDLGFVRSRATTAQLRYTHSTNSRALFMFPPRGLDEAAEPHHLFELRHHLVWWGFLTAEGFDRRLQGSKRRGGRSGDILSRSSVAVAERHAAD